MRRRVWVSTNFTKEPEFLIQTWNKKTRPFFSIFILFFLCCYIWIYDIVSFQVIDSLVLKNLPLSCSWWEGNEMYFWEKMTFTSYWHGSFSIAHATCNQELVANTYIVKNSLLRDNRFFTSHLSHFKSTHNMSLSSRARVNATNVVSFLSFNISFVFGTSVFKMQSFITSGQALGIHRGWPTISKYANDFTSS